MEKQSSFVHPGRRVVGEYRGKFQILRKVESCPMSLVGGEVRQRHWCDSAVGVLLYLCERQPTEDFCTAGLDVRQASLPFPTSLLRCGDLVH